MSRSVWALVLLLALGGCDRKTELQAESAAYAPAPAAAAMMARDKKAAPEGPKLAYSHDLSIETPASAVKPRFEQARDACLTGEVPGCVLIQAYIHDKGEYDAGGPNALIQVRLAHEAVAPFEERLLKPLPGERASDVTIVSRSTSAEDLTAAIQDGDRRLAQLSDYRDRLTQLAKRTDAKVDDLIKVEGEISSTQSQIEELTADQHQLGQRVDTEMLTARITGRSAAPQTSQIAMAWHGAGRILDANVADALQFVVSAVPWVITLAVAILLLPLIRILVRVLWRISRPRGR